MEEVKIIEKPDWITWEQITELLHAAFKEKVDRNLNYLASKMNVEETQEHYENSIDYVALIDNNLAGYSTMRFYTPNPKMKRWHNENSYAYAGITAVHPNYKRYGIGGRLMQAKIDFCHKNNIDEYLTHTAWQAKDVQAFLKKFGAQWIELISSKRTNYYAVRMRIPIQGKKYSDFYTKYKFYRSAIKLILTTDKNGNKRKLFS